MSTPRTGRAATPVNDTGTAPPHTGTEGVLQAHRQALQQRFPMPDAQALRPRARLPKIAATTAACVLACLGLYRWDPGWAGTELHTAPGERRTLALADESTITLDADSRLRVQRHLFSRRVQLLQGRARFSVVHSGWRRFQVDAGAVQVRNYGTVFDVSRQGARSEVTLWRGSVGVQAGGQARRLQPGQRVEAGPQGIGAVRSSEGAQADWPQGRLQFSATPLSQVLAELQRHHPGRIVLDDPALGQLAVSGVFDSDRSASALALLPQILPVVLRPGDDGSVHVRARPQ